MNSIVATCIHQRCKPTVWKGEVARVAEHKYDGHRVTVIRDKDGSFHAIGRKPRINLADRLRLHPTMDPIWNLPPGTALDGELHCGAQSSDVVSVLGTGSTKLVFTPFCVMFVAGGRWLGEDECRVFQQHYDMIQMLGFDPPSRLELHGASPDRETLLNYVSRFKLEGLVLKADPFCAWWKLKPIKTVDCIVTSYEEGTSRNSGRLGNLFVSLLDPDRDCLVEVARVGTGFSDDERIDFWDRRRSLNGQVVEVAYDAIGAGGRLRFPRFVRFRTDKPASDCVLQQIEGDSDA